MSELTQQANDDSQITHVLNHFESNKQQHLSDHGQKLFNAINCLLDDQEQLELTQSLFKYQREHNVFTLVRSCCELFDTPKKKSLMLFMRPVIPIKDRFHYDEYYKLFFPGEFSKDVKSIFTDLIPRDLLEKTIHKANERKRLNLEKEKEKQSKEYEEAIQILEKTNFDLNLDLQKLMSNEARSNTNLNINLIRKPDGNTTDKLNPVTIAGFRIIDLAPDENESLGFDVCLGPTNTFIMISYVEPDSIVEKYGMKAGDELVSVNEISFKMIDLEQAIEVLSTEATMRIVLQTSGFLPELSIENEAMNHKENSLGFVFKNEWVTPFEGLTNPPSESKTKLKRLMRKITISPEVSKKFSLNIRGGIEYQLGIFITKVGTDFDVDLKVSDQIIEVDDQTFSRISNANAVKILKNSLANSLANNVPIKLLVRYLGKMPFLRQIQNESLSDSNDSSINVDDEILSKVNGLKSLISLELENTTNELNLTKSQMNLFKYCVSEYHKSKITMHHFIYLIKIHFKKIIEIENIEFVINKEDMFNFLTLLNEEDLTKSETFSKDIKKCLTTKTTEFLLNSNNLVDLKRMSKSLENL